MTPPSPPRRSTGPGRRLAAVVALMLGVTTLAAPAAFGFECRQQVVVIQVAGSGNGLGPPDLFTQLVVAHAPAVAGTDLDVMQLGAEGHTLGYPALGFPYSTKWFGLWGTPSQRIATYNWSVDQGVAALVHVVGGRYAVTVEGCRPVFLLVGYSQGAQVIRRALPALQPFGASIASIVLIGDPTFDPADASLKYGGSLGPPSASRVGFVLALGGQSAGLPDWAIGKTESVCVRTDPVCQQFHNRLLTPIAALKFALSPFHIWGYTSNVLGPAADQAGIDLLRLIGAGSVNA